MSISVFLTSRINLQRSAFFGDTRLPETLKLLPLNFKIIFVSGYTSLSKKQENVLFSTPSFPRPSQHSLDSVSTLATCNQLTACVRPANVYLISLLSAVSRNVIFNCCICCCCCCWCWINTTWLRCTRRCWVHTSIPRPGAIYCDQST